MNQYSLLSFIKKLDRPVFTTYELSNFSGKSLSTTTQSLNVLKKAGLVIKVYRGIWAEAGHGSLSPYAVIPFLLPRYRFYVSFITALHLHGIIEQIPHQITLASTAHTKTIRTNIGTFSIHHITPVFFKGFGWYNGTGNFLIAEPEKALVDSLYISACRKKQFGYFPELYFPKSFSFNKALKWAKSIPNNKISSYVQLKVSSMTIDNG